MTSSTPTLRSPTRPPRISWTPSTRSRRRRRRTSCASIWTSSSSGHRRNRPMAVQERHYAGRHPGDRGTRSHAAREQSGGDGLLLRHDRRGDRPLGRDVGRYPFDSTGAIAVNATYNGQTIGFALETQTRPLCSAVRSTSTIAHEFAHRWFGDSVSVRTRDHIWLNEGFASFASTSGRSTEESAPLTRTSSWTTAARRVIPSGTSSSPIRGGTPCSLARSTGAGP